MATCDDQQVCDVDEVGLGHNPDVAVLLDPLVHIQQLCYSQQHHRAAFAGLTYSILPDILLWHVSPSQQINTLTRLRLC